ncbi:MAG: outer membrane beta-barrel protein [Bryobacterales bacterium]|nr:outer membrane beta-barrel protein [Bryobacterales bacterium]
MKHFSLLLFLTIAAVATPQVFAQKWEVGFGAGGSFLTSQTITNPLGNADATRDPGLALSAWLDNNIGNGLFGGELRYDHENGDLKLSSNGASTTFASQSNAVHYDFLFNFASSESPIRPFVAAGGGVKWYTGTGAEQVYQPLSDVAVFSDVRDVKALVSVGAGLKFNIAKSTLLRLEVHDYLTPFPNKLIAPVAGSSVGGWLQDFVVSAGLSFTF